MMFLCKPLKKSEEGHCLSSIYGCIFRICVSDDPLEIARMEGSSKYYIATLAQSRMLQLKERKDESKL